MSFHTLSARRVRLTAVVGSALMAAGLLIAPGLAAPASAAPPACADTAASQAAATAMAAACGRPVEVLAARTETTQDFVQPSGVTSRTMAVLPQRVHRADGSWAPVDLSLQARPDGTLAPAASVADVSFSGGGAAPLMTWRKAGHTLTLSWPGTLPTPVVSGNSATYVSVLPGVDLVVTATDLGFKHVLVVHTPAAAADPRVREVHFAVGGDAAVSSDADGSLKASVGGTAFATAEAPVMWDAGAATPGSTRMAGARPLDVDPAGPRSSEVDIAPTARVLGLAASMSGKDLTLRPPATDGLAFPIYLDPDWKTIVPTAAQYSNSTNSNWSVVDGTRQSGETASAPQVWVGNDTTGRLWRGYLGFPTTGLIGKHILSGHVDAVLDHSWPCTAGSDSMLWAFFTTQGLSGFGRLPWTSSIPGGETFDGVIPVSANEASCPKGNVAFSVGAQLAGKLQWVVDQGWGQFSMAYAATYTASGATESTQARWKRINLWSITMTVNFNSAPSVSATSTDPATPCVSNASGPDPNRPFVNQSPMLKATVNDVDPGETLQANFLWQRWNGSGWDPATQGSQGTLSSGLTGSVQPNVGQGVYQWNAYASDGVDVGWSAATCQFEVDTTNPDPPSVSSTDFPPNCTCGSPGWPGTLTLTSNPDTVSFRWGTTNPPSTVVFAASPGAPTTIQWMPTESGPQNLYLQAVDRAGNASAVLTYPITIAPPAANKGRWLQQDPFGGLNLADTSGQPTTHDMTVTGAADPGAPARAPGEFALGLSGTVAAPQYAATSTSVIVTSSAWTASAWVKLATAPTGSNFSTVVSQSAGTYSAFELQARPAGWCLNLPQPGNPGADNSVCGGTVNVGVWTHVAAQYDHSTGTVRLFLNGVQVGTRSTTVTGSTGGLAVGRTTVSGAVSGVLQGSVSDVRVWQRALLPGEIAAMIDNPVLGKYRFGEVDPPEFDESGRFHDLDFVGGASVPNPPQGYDGTGLVVDGTGAAVSREQVVHTDQSFSVSVWAKPASLAASGVVLSADGTNQSGFVLKYSKHFDKWRFGVAPSDTASALSDDSRDSTWPGAQSTVTPAVGRWDYLVATYDATAKQLKLYVNGVLQSTVSNVVNWDATGSLQVGSDIAGTGFVGAIDELRVYAGVVPTWLGDWRFDAGNCTGTPVVCADSATPGHSVTLAGGASQGTAGKDGSGLHITGTAGLVSGAASASGPLLDNTKSFTVSAWVNMAAIDGGAQTVVSAPGVNKSAFELGYQSALFAPLNTWCFTLFSADSGSASSVKACSSSPAVAGTWVHLVGVYDATAGTITLHINGGAANGGETVTANDNQTFLATGALAIGRAGTVSAPAAGFVGDLDNVRIYQGVITDPTLLM